MGRPRKDSNKSDSGSTAGNVYNAVVQQQKTSGNTSSGNSASSGVTPQLEAVSLAATTIAKEVNTTDSTTVSTIASTTDTITATSNNTAMASPVTPALSTTSVTSSTSNTPQSSVNIHRRSLSIAELVSLVSSAKNNTSHSATSTSASALNALNLPEALKNTLEKADSPILNALLPLIRQKLAAKTASNRRNSAVDVSPSLSTTSVETRRSSTSSRSEDHRLSHKLAERKRRKEMKDVFDSLKDALPPGVPKSSKWEILNEASAVIDDLLAQEQALLTQRNQLLKRINNQQ